MALNGTPAQADSNQAGYFALHRTWRDGDTITVSMPMSLRVCPLPGDPTIVAFMVGPFVLAGELGGEGLTEDLVYTKENWYAFPSSQIASVPVLVAEDSDLTSCVQPVAEQPLTYRTVGLKQNVTLVPYHRLFGQRYAVYWQVFRKGSPEYARASGSTRKLKRTC